MKKSLIRTLLLSVVMLAVATSASACPVCFGNSDDQIVKGVDASVLFMMFMTYGLIIGGFGMVVLRFRALAHRKSEQDQNLQSL